MNIIFFFISEKHPSSLFDSVENSPRLIYTIYELNLSQTWQIGDDGFEEHYEYNAADGTLKTMVVQEDTLNFGYDALKRLSAKEVVPAGGTDILTVDYTYKTDAAANTTTTQIESMSYVLPAASSSLPSKLTYTYDVLGNITKVAPEGGTETTYTYGTQNQLLTETTGINSSTYSYDTYGNIRSIVNEQSGIGTTGSLALGYSDTTWLDRLTSVTYTSATGSSTTKNLIYDEVGNPTTYYNGSKTLTMSWRYGRQLSNVVNGSSSYSYAYDVDGIRKSKNVNGVVHDYVTLDGKVVRETWGTTAVIDYFYDNEGKPFKLVVTYGNDTYTGYYVLNQQGDVIAILNGSGNVVVTYTYNAWGKQTAYTRSGTEGIRLYTYNALKYRGYYYDSETGFYYLSSRYYDPVIGRFISVDPNAFLRVFDGGAGLLAYNVYTYCANNPIIYCDSTGESLTLTVAGVTLGTKAIVALVAAISALSVSVSYALNPNFRNGMQQLVSVTMIGISNSFQNAKDAVSAKIELISSSMKVIAQGITNSFARAKTVSNREIRTEDHHIVAQRATKAAPARNVLDNVNIPINSSDNLVTLKKGLHRRLHTNIYYEWVNNVILRAYNSAGKNRDKQTDSVNKALGMIKKYLTHLNKYAPY